MARKRASMREGPLAELFKATEAAQRQAEQQQEAGSPKHEEPQEATVEHVPTWEDEVEAPPAPPTPTTWIFARYEPSVPARACERRGAGSGIGSK